MKRKREKKHDSKKSNPLLIVLSKNAFDSECTPKKSEHTSKVFAITKDEFVSPSKISKEERDRDFRKNKNELSRSKAEQQVLKQEFNSSFPKINIG